MRVERVDGPSSIVQRIRPESDPRAMSAAAASCSPSGSRRPAWPHAACKTRSCSTARLAPCVEGLHVGVPPRRARLDEHRACPGEPAPVLERCSDELRPVECVNGGWKNPSASNKTTTQTPVSATGNFPVDQNGNLVGSLTLSPKTAAELGFSCPPETTTFVSVRIPTWASPTPRAVPRSHCPAPSPKPTRVRRNRNTSC
jgi:hypothetical protein